MNYFIDEIFIPLIINIISSAFVVFIGIESIKNYLKRAEHKRLYGNLKLFWSHSRTNNKYCVVFGCESGNTENFEVEPRIGYSQSFGISEITRSLELIFGDDVSIEFVLLNKDDIFPQDKFNKNIIILGGELVLKKFRQLNLDLKIPYYQHDLDLREREITKVIEGKITESIKSIVDLESKKITYDIGTVTRLINPLNNKLIILFNANYSAGLSGAILAMTQNDQFPINSFDSNSKAQQVVVEVPNIQNNIISRQNRIECKNWIQFSIDTEQVKNAIKTAAS